jgi:hypothetical protein
MSFLAAALVVLVQQSDEERVKEHNTHGRYREAAKLISDRYRAGADVASLLRFVPDVTAVLFLQEIGFWRKDNSFDDAAAEGLTAGAVLEIFDKFAIDHIPAELEDRALRRLFVLAVRKGRSPDNITLLANARQFLQPGDSVEWRETFAAMVDDDGQATGRIADYHPDVAAALVRKLRGAGRAALADGLERLAAREPPSPRRAPFGTFMFWAMIVVGAPLGLFLAAAIPYAAVRAARGPSRNSRRPA